MTILQNALNNKFESDNTEALSFQASHGAKDGEFVVRKWAKGQLMVEVVGGRANQALPLKDWEKLRDNNWKIYT